MSGVLHARRGPMTSVTLLAALIGTFLPGTVHADTMIAIDTPGNGSTMRQPFVIAGWAIDGASTSGPGVDLVQVWAYPNPGSGESPVFVGTAAYGAARGDVGAAFGSQFTNSSYSLRVTGLAPKTYMFAVFARSTVTGAFGPAQTVTVVTEANPLMWVDIPANGSRIAQPFTVAGWAIDVAASSGTGVNTVHVWAYPNPGSGASPIFVGVANYGGGRSDIGAGYGAQFTNSGFNRSVSGLAPGTYQLVAFAYSTVAGGFSLALGVNVDIETPVSAPTISPGGGEYASAVTLSLATATSGAQIHYTTDGSVPTTGSTAYAGPFAIATNGRLTARAFKSGSLPSATVIADYTFRAGVPTFDPPPGTYGGPLTVTLSTQTPGATIRYTTNGTEPTGASAAYTGPLSFAVGIGVTVKARTFKTGWTESATATASYVVSSAAPAPTATPSAGTYDSGQTVSLHADGGAVIRYTTDGADPHEGSISYTGPIVIGSPTLLKARAFLSGHAPSSILSGTYQIRVPSPTITPAGGWLNSPPSVTIAEASPGSTIRFTLDGSEPTESSPVYTGPFVAQFGDRVAAVAFKAGWAPSVEVAATYLDANASPFSAPSLGEVQLSDGNAFGLRSLTEPVAFTVSSASILPGSAAAHLNGHSISVNATDTMVTIPPGLMQEGKNTIGIFAVDGGGLVIADTRTVWAGGRSIAITVRDTQNLPIANAEVIVGPADAWDVFETSVTNTNGTATVPHMPAANVIAEVAAAGYLPTLVPVPDGASTATIVISNSNNDLSQALQGWSELRLAAVVSHEEVFSGFTTCTAPECIRGSSNGSLLSAGSSSDCTNCASAADNDVRLLANNGVAGEVSASRRFRASAGARSATVRFRFATSEIFASPRHEDYYRVRLVNESTGASMSEAFSVSQLTYDVRGASAWRSLTIPASPGDSILMAAAVANVGDTTHPSTLDVDSIQQRTFIGSGVLTEPVRRRDRTKPSGFRVDNDPLGFLSAAPHGYGARAGFTMVNGRLRFTGSGDDWLSSVRLEVVTASTPPFSVAAVGTLTTEAAAALLNRSLGDFGGVHFEGALFEIDSSAFTFQLQSLLSLRVVGQTRLGHSVTVPMGWVDRWAKFPHETGLHRYGNRDMAHCLGTSQPCNGDAWSYPDVISFLDVATSAGEFQIDDISNMNGGWFPTHASHQFGLDIDAYFSGYQDRTKAIAIKLVGILRKHETKIGSILVTMTTAMRRHFESEPPLSDGSAVSSKFINASGHSGHFHVRLKSKEFQ